MTLPFRDSLRYLTVAVSALSSICILAPAPTLALLPFTIAAAELSPLLLLLHSVAITAYRTRPLVLVVLCAGFAISLWPLATVPFIGKGMAAQGLQWPATSKRLDVTVERLPLNTLVFHPVDLAGGPYPIMIDIYGGAWQHGQPSDNFAFHKALASYGYAVFALDYRHAPRVIFPGQVEDIRAGMEWVRTNGQVYNANPEKMVLCGHSSGAELALITAFTANQPFIRGVISSYGPTDLAGGYADVPKPDPIHVRSVLEAYLGGPPRLRMSQYEDGSAIHYVRRGLPPVLLIQGSRDHIVKPRFARELLHKLRAAGNRAYLLELPWAEHAFDAVPGGLGYRISLGYVEEFLRQVSADGGMPPAPGLDF